MLLLADGQVSVTELLSHIGMHQNDNKNYNTNPVNWVEVVIIATIRKNFFLHLPLF